MKVFRSTGIARANLLAMSLAVALTLLDIPNAQAQRFGLGDVGDFGLDEETWNFNGVGLTIDQLNDGYSARFTALEDLAVDRVWQRFVGVDAGTTVEVGIMGDDGSGRPDGTYLASATVDPADGNSIAELVFGSVSLTSGQVYHVVTQAATLGGGESFQVFRSTGNNSIRPFDRASDPSMSGLSRNNGGAWGVQAADPYFILGDSSGSEVGGPGQPYDTPLSTSIRTMGGNSMAHGQRFEITAAEIPAGFSVAITNIRFAAEAIGGIANNLIVSFRDSGLNVLGYATLTPAEGSGSTVSLALDHQSELQQGQTYYLTTEIEDVGSTTTTEGYRFRTLLSHAAGAPNFGGASWGGNTLSVVRGLANNSWGGINATITDQDLKFRFSGLVVPEPSTGLLFLAAFGFLVRRFPRP